MSSVDMTILMAVDPKAAEMAQRLDFAVRLLRKNVNTTETRRRVQSCYHCSKMTAWRTVTMARDIA